MQENPFLNLDKNKKASIKEIAYKLNSKEFLQSFDEKKFEQIFNKYLNYLKEAHLYKSKYILALIDGLLCAVNEKDEKLLYEKIYERERIQKQINEQTELMKANVYGVYETLESGFKEDKKTQNALRDAKLNGVYELGILKEVTEEALLTSIENHADSSAIQVMIKNFVFMAIDSGEFTQQRVLNIVSSVMSASVDIANADSSNAYDLLQGSILGSYDGITKAVQSFNEKLKYSPDEEKLSQKQLIVRQKELHKLDERFIELLKSFTEQKETLASMIIDQIIKKELDATLVKIKRLSLEARELIDARLEQLYESVNVKLEQFKASEYSKKASQSFSEFKNSPKTKQAKAEAERLGKRAWQIAKDFADKVKLT